MSNVNDSLTETPIQESPNTSSDECRKAFELWQAGSSIPAIREGYYETYLFEGWQAAWNAKQSIAVDGVI